MIALARLSLRRPVLALLAWTAVAVALGAVGFGVAHQLSPSILVVPGSESARAEHLANAQFGPSQLTPILLRGPQGTLDRQGPALVLALRARPHTRVLSAWDTGSASAALRPSPTARMIVVSVDRPETTVLKTDLPQIERLVHNRIQAPARAHITGQASIDAALKSAMIEKTRRAELLAIPLLFLVLLVLLRAPVAAFVVTTFGATTVFAGMGVMTLLARVVDTDPTAVAVGSLAGLALGVGFALMIVERFREERTRGTEPHPSGMAAARTVATGGRAVLWGGTAFALCLILAVLISPTVILGSLGIGVLLCVLLSTGAAAVVMPAVLVILGHRLEAGSFPAPRPVAAAWARLIAGGSWVTRHPAPLAGLGVAALLVLAVPALGLNTGPPDVTQLPKSAQARKDFEAVNATMGAGWATPYNVVVASKDQPITSASLLRSIDSFQTQIAHDPQVASVVGPGALVTATKDLKKLPTSLNDSKKLLKGGKKDLGRLAAGLGQAGAGATQLRAGLGDAASGAGQLQSGGSAAASGAGKLHAGLAQARAGAAKITAGLASALNGATALKKGATAALAGSRKLAGGLGTGSKTVKAGLPAFKQLADTTGAVANDLGQAKTSASGVTGQLDAAIAKLSAMTTGKNDPAYAAALSELTQARSSAAGLGTTLDGIAPKATTAAALGAAISSQGTQLSAGLNQLSAGSTALASGIAQLQSGNSQLAAGIDKLGGGGKQLTSGLSALTDGAGALEAGLGQLTNGAGQLATGLSAGTGPTGKLISGLGVMQAKVHKFAGSLPSAKDLEQLQRDAPGLFDSGYFVLAAVEGAPSVAREQATFTINLLHGGTAGQIVVVPKQSPGDPATRALGDRLHSMSDGFAARTQTQVAVGGPAGNLADFTSASSEKLPLVVFALALATALLLMLALRSVLVPIVAVALNLFTVAATFGVLTLLFTGSDPLLGGPGYIDAMSIIAIFSATFGLSIAYQVFLLARMREHVLAGDGPRAAARHGLRQTAAAVTGTAAVMVAATIPFLFADLLSVRQFGVAVVTVVLLDALLVRPVVLPAVVELLGWRAWWPTRAPHPMPGGTGAAPPSRPTVPPRIDPTPV
ncbi:MAG TPA: MMPL family transporter [Solirubrobacteraceae bacterium]